MCPSFRLAAVLSLSTGNPSEFPFLGIISADLQALYKTVLIPNGYEDPARLIDKRPVAVFLPVKPGDSRKIISVRPKLLRHHTHSRNGSSLVSESVDFFVEKSSASKIVAMVLCQT